MGRRKIEIQPITHERNRSVTFLKRKNGLFKKAYELGVLCSVDVAVIIFEERPGHHVKLYQYCSSDIHEMVQRHMRHDGEKDTRGPADFSGNSNLKLGDMGDDDEDDEGDHDDDPRLRKRSRDGKSKPNDLVNGLDYGHNHGPRNLSIPQPPNLSIHTNNTSLPISETRRRLGIHPHSRSPSDDVSNNGYGYTTGHNSGPFGGQGQYGNSRQHSAPQHFFPVPQASPTSSFLPLQSDFPRGPNSSRGSTGSAGGYRSNSNSSYDQGMYNGMMNHRSGPPQAPNAVSNTNGTGNDLFATFLDPNDQGRPGINNGTHPQSAPSQQGSSFVGLDWPVHTSSSGPPPPSASAGNDAPNGTNSHWLDFLASNTNGNATNGRESMSWERGGGGSGPTGNGSNDHGHRNSDLTGMFGSGGPGDRGRMGGSPMVMGISASKRRLDDDVSGNGLLPSPPGANGRSDDGKTDGTG